MKHSAAIPIPADRPAVPVVRRRAPWAIGLGALLFLAACGADGKPIAPKYSVETTVGYNSATGPFNETVLGICVGDAC